MGKMRWGKEVVASQCEGINDSLAGGLQSRLYLHSYDFICSVTTLFTRYTKRKGFLR
jgi:hypothetical protein